MSNPYSTTIPRPPSPLLTLFNPPENRYFEQNKRDDLHETVHDDLIPSKTSFEENNLNFELLEHEEEVPMDSMDPHEESLHSDNHNVTEEMFITPMKPIQKRKKSSTDGKQVIIEYIDAPEDESFYEVASDHEDEEYNPYKPNPKKQRRKRSTKDISFMDEEILDPTKIDPEDLKKVPREVRSLIGPIKKLKSYSAEKAQSQVISNMKKTKSGRLSVPPLDYWRGQYKKTDAFGNVIEITEGSPAIRPSNRKGTRHTIERDGINIRKKRLREFKIKELNFEDEELEEFDDDNVVYEYVNDQEENQNHLQDQDNEEENRNYSQDQVDETKNYVKFIGQHENPKEVEINDISISYQPIKTKSINEEMRKELNAQNEEIEDQSINVETHKEDTKVSNDDNYIEKESANIDFESKEHHIEPNAKHSSIVQKNLTSKKSTQHELKRIDPIKINNVSKSKSSESTIDDDESQDEMEEDIWDEEQIECLRKAILKYDPDDPKYWFKISTHVPRKSAVECVQKYLGDLKENKSKKASSKPKKTKAKKSMSPLTLGDDMRLLKNRKKLRSLRKEKEENHRTDMFESPTFSSKYESTLKMISEYESDDDDLYAKKLIDATRDINELIAPKKKNSNSINNNFDEDDDSMGESSDDSDYNYFLSAKNVDRDKHDKYLNRMKAPLLRKEKKPNKKKKEEKKKKANSDVTKAIEMIRKLENQNSEKDFLESEDEYDGSEEDDETDRKSVV